LIDSSKRRFSNGFEVIPTKSKTLLGGLRRLIAEARQDVARQVNSALVLLYWRIGKRIRRDVLKEKRGEYGEETVATLSQRLTREFGNGFGRRNLFNMTPFAEVFTEERIVHALSTQLGWTHL
jgi:uncharacterized protein DUF1016